jgi:hypothetical protein
MIDFFTFYGLLFVIAVPVLGIAEKIIVKFSKGENV